MEILAQQLEHFSQQILLQGLFYTNQEILSMSRSIGNISPQVLQIENIIQGHRQLKNLPDLLKEVPENTIQGYRLLISQTSWRKSQKNNWKHFSQPGYFKDLFYITQEILSMFMSRSIANYWMDFVRK